MVRSNFPLWKNSALLGLVLSSGMSGSANAGCFDWLWGKPQPAYPVASYNVPTTSVPYGQNMSVGYGSYAYPQNMVNYSPVQGVPTYANFGATAPVAPTSTCNKGGTCGAPLPVYPTGPNPATTTPPVYPSNANVPPVLPSNAVTGPPTFQSYYNRAAVTYYRPVTTMNPATGQPVTQLQACTSYEYQTMRAPIYGFQPFAGWNNNYAQAPTYPVAPTSQSTNGSSSFIAVPSSGMAYNPSVSNPYVVGYAPMTGANLAGTIPPSLGSTIYSANPIPSYPPPTRVVVPGAIQPQAFSYPTASNIPVVPSQTFVSPVVPSAAIQDGSMINPVMPAIGTGVAPSTGGFTAPPPPSTSVPNSNFGSSSLGTPSIGAPPANDNYWAPSSPQPSSSGSGSGSSLSDPESSVKPVLPSTPNSSTNSNLNLGDVTANDSKPRFGISRVTQEQQPEQQAAKLEIPQTLPSTEKSAPNPFSYPSNETPLKPIPAPEGSDLTPQWNRGLLDSRDLTASVSNPERIRQIDNAPATATSSSNVVPAQYVQPVSISNRTSTEKSQPSKGSAGLRPSTQPKKKPGRLIEAAKPAISSAPTKNIDSSGWAPKRN